MADINIRSNYFAAQYKRNTLIRDMLDGLDALRGAVVENNAGESVYLPKFPDEPQSVYNLRVKRTYLTNYFARALDSDSGKILAKKISISADGGEMPDMFWPWLDDTDLEGKPMSVLARDQLQMACAKGATLAYVDHSEGEKGRPFVREIDIDNVLTFRADNVTGKLTFLRWQDSIPDDSEEDGIINANVVFEITPTTWAMYRIDEDGGETDTPDEQGEIVRYRNGSERITDELPVSIFYTNKTGKLLAESPYRTLLELTLEHFQVYSDLKNMLFYALQPILQVTNAPADFEMSTLASYLCVKFPESQYPAEMKWVQVDSGPIIQAREQIQDIERRIASFSIDNSAIRPGNQTATQSAIDASGANAALRSFAEGLEEHLERIIEFMSSYTLQPEIDIDVDITPDFSVKDDIEDIKILQADVAANRITLEMYLEALVKCGILPETLDIPATVEQLGQVELDDTLGMSRDE